MTDPRKVYEAPTLTRLGPVACAYAKLADELDAEGSYDAATSVRLLAIHA